MILNMYFRSKSGQQYYLEGMESIVTKHDVYLDILSKVLESLYDKDILTDNNILVRLLQGGGRNKICHS